MKVKDVYMGLGFSAEGYDNYTAPHWSYSGFAEFRKKVANSIAIDLYEMQGFGKMHQIDSGYYKKGTIPWDDIKSPIKLFLNHSDCDGFLSAEQCGSIYPVLRTIVDLWEDSPILLYSREDKQKGMALAAMMEYCSRNEKTLVFC
jgi:hypothetical protein